MQIFTFIGRRFYSFSNACRYLKILLCKNNNFFTHISRIFMFFYVK